MKVLINLKKEGFKLSLNWQDLSHKSIFFLNTKNKKNFIDYQKKAIKKKCRHIICSEEFKDKYQFKELKYFYFKNNDELFKIAKLFFKTNKSKLIFITGTNGKTSVAFGAHQLMTLNNIKSSYIGTLGFYVNSKKIKILKNTTPSFFELLDLIIHAESFNIDYIFIEASSIGYSEGRLGYLKYDFCFLTNLKSDHLDYHLNLKNYHNAKLNLIKDHLKKNSKILIQDPLLIKNFKKIKSKVLNQENFIFKNNIKIHHTNMGKFEILSSYGKYKINTFNDFVIKNTISIFFLYETLINKWPKNFTKQIFPKGRSEIVFEKNGNLIMVDYAHSADAFNNLLKGIPNHFKNKIVLYGCGGNRDQSKRPKIAKTVSKFSTLQIITDDNPRNESPKSIRDMLFLNSKNPINIANREMAIKYGVKFIKKYGGILIIAGKGHENTQIIKNKVIKFSDHLIIKKYAKDI